MHILQEEAESEEEFDENSESLEPTTFVGVPAEATDDQPGPSGLNKTSGLTTDTGWVISFYLPKICENYEVAYVCSNS